MNQLLINQENFTKLMDKIIQSELSPTQQQTFQFEGRIIIKKLFEQNNLDLEKSLQIVNGKVFHLNEFNEVVRIGAEFIKIICSCLVVYLKFSQAKIEKNKELREEQNRTQVKLDAKEKKVKLLKELKSEMENQSLPKEMVDLITTKYEKELLELIEEL